MEYDDFSNEELRIQLLGWLKDDLKEADNKFCYSVDCDEFHLNECKNRFGVLYCGRLLMGKHDHYDSFEHRDIEKLYWDNIQNRNAKWLIYIKYDKNENSYFEARFKEETNAMLFRLML